MSKKSPLAPLNFPDLPPISGVEIAGAACGLKVSGRADLFVARLAPGTTVAGAFTRSLCPSGPVDWCRKILPKGRARAIVVNSGNANAFTGKAGDRTVDHTVKAAAKLIGCPRNEVYIASTGVIGVPVPPDYIADKLPDMAKKLAPGSWSEAAAAILTTDTFPKGSVRSARIGDAEITIAGIAKGSGMIAPDMATMLGFLFTDAKIPADVLQTLLTRAVDDSFNATTVDGDTSTSDTVLLCATGAGAKHPEVVTARDPRLADFKRALAEVTQDLAIQIVRDGEGAQKLITIDVTGAASRQAARKIGLAIANSPLVKTAAAGGDPNWGRLVMAVGKSGQKADRDLLSISIGGVPVTENGQRRSDYDEAAAEAHMAGSEIHFGVDIGLGKGRARVWTCDLTHGYITVNADYRT
jgi:glutamate N-acetyltransferase / amino-acid N-acetyltransferase